MKFYRTLYRLCLGGFLLLGSGVQAGVRFQNGPEVRGFDAAIAHGPVQVRLPTSATAPEVMRLPAAVAVTPTFNMAPPSLMITPSTGIVSPTAAELKRQKKQIEQAEAARKARTKNLALQLCGENLALIRGLALVTYQQKMRRDVMDVVLAAAVAERQTGAGAMPNLKSLKAAVAAVPFYIVGMTDIRQALQSARAVCAG